MSIDRRLQRFLFLIPDDPLSVHWLFLVARKLPQANFLFLFSKNKETPKKNHHMDDLQFAPGKRGIFLTLSKDRLDYRSAPC